MRSHAKAEILCETEFHDTRGKAGDQIFALFPATCTNLYGNKFATTNYSMLYTAKGTAALLVPLGNALTTATGGRTAVFMVASALNILAALLAFAVLKPMRIRSIPKENLGSIEYH
jgi:MFS transporter, OFA family, oxalate/formate antiporter